MSACKCIGIGQGYFINGYWQPPAHQYPCYYYYYPVYPTYPAPLVPVPKIDYEKIRLEQRIKLLEIKIAQLENKRNLEKKLNRKRQSRW